MNYLTLRSTFFKGNVEGEFTLLARRDVEDREPDCITAFVDTLEHAVSQVDEKSLRLITRKFEVM